VRHVLERGSVVNGASRFRWDGLHPDAEALSAALAVFPDGDPALPFRAGNCLQVTLHGPGVRIEIPREIGARRRMFRRSSFWDALMEFAGRGAPEYVEYSYRLAADIYRASLDLHGADAVREMAPLLSYKALERQLRTGAVARIEFLVRR
jgi:hypothetical protein